MVGKTKLKILQIIAHSPQYGYALSKKLGVSVSSIYDHLNDLEKMGLAKKENEEGKKFYSITANGELLLKALKGGISEKANVERVI